MQSLQDELNVAEKRHAEALAALVSPDMLATLEAESERATAALEQASHTQEKAEAERRAASTEFTESSRNAQEAEAHQRSVAEALRTARTTQQRAQLEAEALTRELDKVRAEAVADTVVAEAKQARIAHENALAQTGTALEQAEQTLSDHKARQNSAREAHSTLQTELTRLQAQAEGLDQALGQDSDVAENPVSAQITVPEAYESALAAALAEGWMPPQTPPPHRAGDYSPPHRCPPYPAVHNHLKPT